MTERNKIFWRKRWTSPRHTLLGWALLTGILFLIIFSIGWAVALQKTGELAVMSLIWAVVLASVVILGSATLRRLRLLASAQNLRRALFGIVCLATLIAVFYVEENVRGNYVWQKFKNSLDAQGIPHDLSSIIPPPVPDEQNFAMTPLWVESICATLGTKRGTVWYGDKVAALGHTNFQNRLDMPREHYGNLVDLRRRLGDWKKAELTDLADWSRYYRKAALVTNYFPVTDREQSPAEDVLLALSIHDRTIEELRQARRLPYSRFPISYHDDDPAGILLPHLAKLKGIAMTLELRAIAALQAGQSEKAWQEVNLIFGLIEAVRTEPFAISHLVRIAVLSVGLQAIWEGLVHHQWTDAQLSAIAARLDQLDFLADYQSTMRGELVFGLRELDYIRLLRDQHPQRFTRMFIDRHLDLRGGTDTTSILMNRLAATTVKMMPAGWFKLNQRALAQARLQLQLPPSSLEKRTISVEEVNRRQEAANQVDLLPFGLLSYFFTGWFEMLPRRYVYGQTITDMTRVACALERYRLAHEEYPETLATLAPPFIPSIPLDPIDGQPLRYRRNEDGGYVLYSLGWNETDEGGITEKDLDKGDWTWTLPVP